MGDPIAPIGPRASRPQRALQNAGWRSRGYLPHLDAPDLIQHVIFKLADSLPARIREEIAKIAPADRIQAVVTSSDRGYGRRYLEIPEIAQLVQRALLQFDSERYSLIAWCVMPNHVHTLIETRTGRRLDRAAHAWKSFTAKQANQHLGRGGAFWAPEYFDRYMRDDTHFAATRAYIERNPVKAGLCQEVSDWRFSSAWLK
jgi:REP element-mobilizing transposase RayT